MRIARVLSTVIAVAALLIACGDDQASPGDFGAIPVVIAS